MTYKIKGESPFQVLSTNFSIGPSNEGYTLQVSADGNNFSNLFSVGANTTRMVTGVASGSYYRLSGNNSEVSVNWRTSCNDGQGGGGGSSQYAESAGTAETAIISNSTRLLDGVPDFPQDANNGDVVAIGSTPTRGTKRPLPSTGIYQYDGSAWTPIGGETDFTELKPVSSFPENPVAGEVVAIVEQPEVVESLNPTRGGAKSPVQPEEVSIYQYDGVNWNKIGGGEGSSAYKIELSTENPDDFTEEDIANLNAFFAAVIITPSIKDTAYLEISTEIYHISSARYNEQDGEGEFNFVLSYPNWSENLTIGYEMEEFSFAETRKWEGNTLVPAIEFPQDPAPGEIANYDDGEGNVGLYQYDADNDEWVPFGGGDNTVLKHSDEMPVDIEVGDVYATHTDAEGVVIGDDWIDSGEQNIQYDRDGDGNPQAIRIAVSENDVIHLSWAIEPWDTGEDITIGDGVLYVDYGFSGNGTSELRFVDEGWMENTGGKSVVIFLDNGTLYLYTEDNSIIWIYGVDDNNTGNNVYEGEVIPAHPAFDNVYQAVEDESGNTVGSRLAKASELPDKINLVPDGEPNYGLILKYNDKPRWEHPAELIPPIFVNIPTEGDYQGYPTYLKRNGQQEFAWTKLERNSIEAVSALPTTSNDGNVYAYANASGYGIVQAQSGTPAQGWSEGNTSITGYTQIRVPYTASDTTYLEFAFEGYSDLHNLWWHYDEGNEPHWDGDNVPIDEQVDGEFSGVDGDGVSISCVRDGDYLVVTFGEAISHVEEIINTEIYGTYIAPNYTNVVTSDSINRIWKGTQAQYDALAPNYDNNTFYIIL